MLYKNFVGGVWHDCATGELFDNINPAHNGQVISQFQKSAKVDIDRAVEYAEAAFKFWRKVPAPKRGEILFRAAEILVRDKECIAK